MTPTPIISVIMPVYNCEKYVYDAVQSVLNQIYTDFELLIVDDCSTDSTVSIIESISDDRIHLIKKEKNSGYTDSLNYAITIAKGKFIARMDGDDICLPNRFQKQIDAMNANEDVILCGTAIQIIDSEKILSHPVNHDDIKVKLCFSNAFFHPTVLFRKEVFADHQYNKEFEPAEDYDLWTRLVFKGKLMNIDEVLLNYRIHQNQISNYKNEVQMNAMAIAQLRMFQMLFENEEIDIQLYKKAFKNNDVHTMDEFKLVMNLFEKIQINNDRLGIYKKDYFNTELQKSRINFLKRYYVKNRFSLKDIFTFLSIISWFDIFEIIKKRV